MDLNEYLSAQELENVLEKHGVRLKSAEFTILRGLNGTLGYGLGARPEGLGELAELTASVKISEDEGPTWGHVAQGNALLKWLQETSEESKLWFPPLGDGKWPGGSSQCPWLKLVLISDSAFANVEEKRSQNAFVLCLMEVSNEGQLGGRIHVLDWSSRKSTRVARSTFMGELLAATAALERGEVLQMMLHEIWGNGFFTPRQMQEAEPIFAMESVVDARSLFDAVTSPDIGKITDKSCLIYLLAYRELVNQRRLRRVWWVPTEAMLADDLTKRMLWGSGLWPLVYAHGWWSPFPRDDLEEDYVSMEPDGKILRWRFEERHWVKPLYGLELPPRQWART
jgi:hypothetical protein